MNDLCDIFLETNIKSDKELLDIICKKCEGDKTESQIDILSYDLYDTAIYFIKKDIPQFIKKDLCIILDIINYDQEYKNKYDIILFAQETFEKLKNKIK